MNRIELEERLIDFSVLIIQITSQLNRSKASNIIENQILRSSMSVSLNFGESLAAESENDFIHKMQIVLKELRETYNGLRITKKANLCKDIKSLTNALDENNQLISIFVKSIDTKKRNLSGK